MFTGSLKTMASMMQKKHRAAASEKRNRYERRLAHKKLMKGLTKKKG